MNTRDLEPGIRTRNAMEMADYFGRVVAQRRVRGAEDLITVLVQAELDGERLPEVELLGFCVLLLIAGNETTTSLIGNMLNLLAARPELWRRVREDRSLVEPTIEEALRYESPVQTLFRFVRRNTEIGGREIFQHTSVGWASERPTAAPRYLRERSNSISNLTGAATSPSAAVFIIVWVRLWRESRRRSRSTRCSIATRRSHPVRDQERARTQAIWYLDLPNCRFELSPPDSASRRIRTTQRTPVERISG
jgi:hypothetical protein